MSDQQRESVGWMRLANGGRAAPRRQARSLGVLALAWTLASCVGQPAAGELNDPNDEVERPVEEAYPGETGEARTGTFDVSGVTESLEYQLLHNEAVYQGDIILTPEGAPAQDLGVSEESAEPPPDLLEPPPPEQTVADTEIEDLSSTSEAIAARTTRRLWPRGVVYYTVDPRLPNKDRVWNAIRHWHANTPVRFVRRTTQAGYVTFTTSSGGCSAEVGYTGRRQYIRLGSRCSTGSTVHEMGHAVGLWHEQSRTDRNQYVTIHWDNISSGHRGNFETFAQRGLDGRNIGTYDTGSIMHYGSYAFSRNGRPTITRRGGGTFSSQRRGLSARDIAGIRAIYPVRR